MQIEYFPAAEIRGGTYHIDGIAKGYMPCFLLTLHELKGKNASIKAHTVPDTIDEKHIWDFIYNTTSKGDTFKLYPRDLHTSSKNLKALKEQRRAYAEMEFEKYPLIPKLVHRLNRKQYVEERTEELVNRDPYYGYLIDEIKGRLTKFNDTLNIAFPETTQFNNLNIKRFPFNEEMIYDEFMNHHADRPFNDFNEFFHSFKNLWKTHLELEIPIDFVQKLKHIDKYSAEWKTLYGLFSSDKLEYMEINLPDQEMMITFDRKEKDSEGRIWVSYHISGDMSKLSEKSIEMMTDIVFRNNTDESLDLGYYMKYLKNKL